VERDDELRRQRFFLTASELITVKSWSYALPGVGSYVGIAVEHGQFGHVVLGIVTMVIMILVVNFLFWRPLVAYVERFHVELSQSDSKPRSLVLSTLRRSNWPAVVGRGRRAVHAAGRLGAGQLPGEFHLPVRHRGLPGSGDQPQLRRDPADGLGTKWYVLFNVIAGASAVPSDLKDAMDNLGVRGRQRWRRLILAGIFPAYVTGVITAAGGAWNASIVAEIVRYNGHVLTASGRAPSSRRTPLICRPCSPGCWSCAST
jgi:ABC-type anion transport system duplicated permease subunit